MAKSLRRAARGRFLPFAGCEVSASLVVSAVAAFAVGQLPSLEAVGKGAAQLSFARIGGETDAALPRRASGTQRSMPPRPPCS